MSKTMYRYEQQYFETYQELICLEFDVLKETKCGVWIYVSGFTRNHNQTKKFINLGSGKKWACTTKEEALKQFMYRKETQIRILNSTLQYAKEAVEIAKEQLDKLKEGSND